MKIQDASYKLKQCLQSWQRQNVQPIVLYEQSLNHCLTLSTSSSEFLLLLHST